MALTKRKLMPSVITAYARSIKLLSRACHNRILTIFAKIVDRQLRSQLKKDIIASIEDLARNAISRISFEETAAAK